MSNVDFNSPYSPLQSSQFVNQGQASGDKSDVSQAKSTDFTKYQDEIAKIREKYKTDPSQAEKDLEALSNHFQQEYDQAREEISKQYAPGSNAYREALRNLDNEVSPFLTSLQNLIIEEAQKRGR